MTISVTVDIKTRFLSDNQRAYFVFPGQGYKYYEVMKESQAVFLTIPGFELREEDIALSKDVLQRVVMSDRIQEWHRNGCPIDKQPPRSVAEVGNYVATARRKQLAAFVRTFFTRINSGDIIVVPPKKHSEDILFGEVLANDEPLYIELPDFPGEKVPAIGVRWVKAVARERAPNWIERRITSPNPVRQIENSHIPLLCDLIYERYYYNGEFACKFFVRSTQFSTFDSFVFQQFVLYTASLHEAAQTDDFSRIETKSLSDVVLDSANLAEIPNQRVSINSPGHIVLFGRNIVPILAGVLMSLATAGASEAEPSQIDVLLENSSEQSHISQACVAEVAEEVRDELDAMGYSRWQELCRLREAANSRTAVNPGMDVRSEVAKSPSGGNQDGVVQ